MWSGKPDQNNGGKLGQPKTEPQTKESAEEKKKLILSLNKGGK
jgi:hypothetical protein